MVGDTHREWRRPIGDGAEGHLWDGGLGMRMHTPGGGGDTGDGRDRREGTQRRGMERGTPEMEERDAPGDGTRIDGME